MIPLTFDKNGFLRYYVTKDAHFGVSLWKHNEQKSCSILVHNCPKYLKAQYEKAKKELEG